jgi:hypothetical protein
MEAANRSAAPFRTAAFHRNIQENDSRHQLNAIESIAQNFAHNDCLLFHQLTAWRVKHHQNLPAKESLDRGLWPRYAARARRWHQKIRQSSQKAHNLLFLEVHP